MTTAAPPAVPDTVRERLSHDAWSRDRLLAFQQERLRSLLAGAVARSPYYRETLGPDAADTPLAELPVLTKATLMERFDEIVTDPSLRLADVSSFAASASPGALYRGRHRIFATSGSTGVPAVFVFAQDEFMEWVGVCLALLARHGVRPETRLAAIGAPADVHITRQLFASFVNGREGAPRLSVSTPVGEVVKELNRYRPEVLVSYASVIAALAEEQLRGRLAIEPWLTVAGSEVLTDEAGVLVERAWGRQPVNVYAATEAPGIACGRVEDGGLSVVEDALVLEVVDESGKHVAPGVPGAKVLLTNLVNHAQPLIRYELSDSVVLADGPDTAGRPYLRIARIDGRSDDALTFARADGTAVRVDPFRLRAPFSTLLDVLQYQIVQERGGALRVDIVPRGASSDDLLDAVRALGR